MFPRWWTRRTVSGRVGARPHTTNTPRQTRAADARDVVCTLTSIRLPRYNRGALGPDVDQRPGQEGTR